ncbi:hypothetical protein ACMHYB_61345 [Sorangium sp. So ce1128]
MDIKVAMDIFDIYFLDESPGADLPGCQLGEICISSFREKFVSDVTFWPRFKYEQQWIAAAMRIMTGDRVAMITSLNEPSLSNFVRWWALYRDGNSIAIQQQLCFLEELREPFDPEVVDKFVEPRRTISEDGQSISEWYTTVAAISEFLTRRSRSS